MSRSSGSKLPGLADDVTMENRNGYLLSGIICVFGRVAQSVHDSSTGDEKAVATWHFGRNATHIGVGPASQITQVETVRKVAQGKRCVSLSWKQLEGMYMVDKRAVTFQC